jgi:hypothetical protein
MATASQWSAEAPSPIGMLAGRQAWPSIFPGKPIWFMIVRLSTAIYAHCLRVRRIERVRLHADLTILARLATALAKART